MAIHADFLREHGPKTPEEAEQIKERLKKEPLFEDGEYEEPEPPARTIEDHEHGELPEDAYWDMTAEEKAALRGTARPKSDRAR